MTLFLLPAGPAQAQTTCTPQICTVRVASDSPVVDGCGDHATPGRFKFILESTDSSVTRASFPTVLFIEGGIEYRTGDFTEWEWRNKDQNNNRWNDNSNNDIGFGGGVLGENIIEVRPKAGAHIWSNRDASDPNQGPGELVVQTFRYNQNSLLYTPAGSAYFLFMGGKGCARVNEGGGLLGGNQ